MGREPSQSTAAAQRLGCLICLLSAACVIGAGWWLGRTFGLW